MTTKILWQNERRVCEDLLKIDLILAAYKKRKGVWKKSYQKSMDQFRDDHGNIIKELTPREYLEHTVHALQFLESDFLDSVSKLQFFTEQKRIQFVFEQLKQLVIPARIDLSDNPTKALFLLVAKSVEG